MNKNSLEIMLLEKKIRLTEKLIKKLQKKLQRYINRLEKRL